MQTIEYMNSEEIKQQISDSNVSIAKIHKFVIKGNDETKRVVCFIDIYYKEGRVEVRQAAIRESVYDMLECKGEYDEKGIEIGPNITLYTKLIAI